jgi:hypothetical protein
MDPTILAVRVVTAALGFVLIGKLLFEYFVSSRRSRHPDPRVHRLNRVRVYAVFVFLGGPLAAVPAYELGVPFRGVLVLFGAALVAAVVYCVSTIRVILRTGRL